MLSPQCGGVAFTPPWPPHLALCFLSGLAQRESSLGCRLSDLIFSGVKRPDSDVRMRRAVIITPRLIASQEPIFLYSHSQNRFKVFTTSVSNIQCIQAHLDSFVCRFCTDAILIFICSYSYPNVLFFQWNTKDRMTISFSFSPPFGLKQCVRSHPL